MATYSAVTAGEKDADSPINVSLIDKLDQNPHAIAEGASGAPKIQTAAIQDNAVNNDKLEKAYYAGQISEDGTTNDLPSGWSASRIWEGVYLITHNLGSSDYAVVVTADNVRICSYSNKNTNSVQISTRTSANNADDSAFNFIIMTY